MSIEKGKWVQVQKLDIPDNGLEVWPLEFDYVKLFRTWLKNQPRHYIVFIPNLSDYDAIERPYFQKLRNQHWEVEQYHRTIKQVCNIETFKVCNKVAILNHVFAALYDYVYLQQMRFTDIIVSVYKWQRDLYASIIKLFISNFAVEKEYLNPQFNSVVNA